MPLVIERLRSMAGVTLPSGGAGRVLAALEPLRPVRVMDPGYGGNLTPR